MKLKINRRSRGTILILVVAVLGLLVVMGTAYLATSRTDSTATKTMNDAVNLDLATKSIFSEVQSTLFESSTNPANGSLFGGLWAANKAYAVDDLVVSPIDGQIYKALGAHTSSYTAEGPPPANTTRWTAVLLADINALTATTASTYGVARLFESPDLVTPVYGRSKDNPGYRSQAWLASTLVPGADLSAPDISFTMTNRYSPDAGTYSLPNAAAGEVSAMGGTNGHKDAGWNMLPFSTAGGVRYRYALRMVDTNRMLNLNVGQVATNVAALSTAQGGQVLTSAWLNFPMIYSAETNLSYLNFTPGGLNGVRGRGQAAVVYTGSFPSTIAAWQDVVLGYEKLGINPAANLTTPGAEWYDLTDELELRAYGTQGNNYMARPAANTAPSSIWPNTLGAGKATRANYTTYSFDRNTPSAALLATQVPYTMTIGANNYRWLGLASNLSKYLGRRMNLVLPTAAAATIDASTAADEIVAQQAIYLINLMSAAGYSADEAFSYAVNYVAQTSLRRRDSYIDPAGLHIAGFDTAAIPHNQFAVYAISPAPTHRYYGWSAQPFINEVALVKQDSGVGGSTIIKDFAVELMNPYSSAAISLDGWRLRIVTSAGDYVKVLSSSEIINTQSTYVFYADTGVGLNATAIGTDKVAVDYLNGATNLLASTTDILDGQTNQIWVYLERPYPTVGFVVVDRYQLKCPPTVPPSSGGDGLAKMYSAQRPNTAPAGGTSNVASGTDRWLSMTTTNATDGSVVAAHTLGAVNAAAIVGDTVHFGIYMRDRIQTPAPVTQLGVLSTLGNIGDLAWNYARMCNMQVYNTTTFVFDPAPLTSTLTSATSVAGSQFAEESKLYFDFAADPRAQMLLNMVAPYERASDGYDQLGNGTVDEADEARLPGRINVNTASYPVLCAMIQGACPYLSPMDVAQRAAYIIAYRTRVNANTLSYTGASYAGYTYDPVSDPVLLHAPAGVVPDFSNATYFPGRGIHSLTELIVPMGVADMTMQFAPATVQKFTTRIQDASAHVSGAKFGISDTFGRGGNGTYPFGSTWSRLLATATTRSDTFVVYGYVEAVKRNPNFDNSFTFNNADDWYDHGGNPTNTNGTASRSPAVNDPLILVGQRRFIAIVDRSWSNQPQGSGTVLPKIVAYKELPR